MSNLDAGTVVAYLAGAAAFACVVMVAYWGMQRVPPGFGLWTASSGLVAIGCFLLADRGHVPVFVATLVVPSAIVLAAGLRLEGLRRYLGREHFDRRTLLLPVIAVGLLAVFAYALESLPARSLVTAAAIALVFEVTAGAVFRSARGRHRLFYRFLGALFVVYGAMWLGCGIYWLARSTGFPLLKMDTLGFIFFTFAMAFEFFWVIACLILSAKRNTDDLEVAHGVAEAERRQLADIVASLPDPTFALDKDHRVIAWNRLLAELSGISAQDVLGKKWDEGGFARAKGRGDTLAGLLLDPTKAVPARYLKVERQGDSLSADEQMNHPEIPGKSLHLWHTATLLRDAGGEVVGALESVRDMSWRAETEGAIRESEERYRSLFEQSLDGILVIAADGTVLDANPAACLMLGMTKEELHAVDPGDLIQGSVDTEQRRQGRPALGTAVQELTFVRKDGTSFPAESMSVVWNDAVGHLRAFVQFRDIGDRLEAQRSLQESEARLLEAQAASHVGNWEIDLVAQSIWLSPEALRIYGIERASPYFPLENAELSSLSEDPGPMVAAMKEVMSRGGSYDVEYHIRRADNAALRTVHSFGAATCDEAGNPTKVVGAIQDVTAVKRAEGAPDFAQYSVDHAGDQVFWIDPSGRFIFVSDSTCAQLGYTREELLNMTIQDVDPTVEPNWPEGWETLKRLGSRQIEAVHRTKDGRDIPVEVSVNYVLHNGQEYNFAFARDISERKRLEDVFRKTQVSVDRVSDQVFWTSPEGRFVFVTDSTCRQLGYTREELLEMSNSDVDPTAPGDWRLGWAKLKEQGTLTRETIHRAKDGTEMPVEIMANYVEHDGKEYGLVFARNIGERRQEPQLSTKGEMEALQFQKLEAVGQLAGGIAHDFNNLLTAIIGYGNLILANEEAQGLKSLRRDAEEIRSAAERAASLTSQILAFARRQALRPRVASLNELIAGMGKSLRPILGDNIELKVLQHPEASFVDIDTEQFEQVVANLVRNACDAMPDGGRLVLEVRDVDLTEEYCQAYPELQPGNYVLLAVSDTGIGMDPETKLRIFEPFFTTKKPGEGAGLGLSVVYGTVRQSGGHVVAYSEIDKGTTFKVYLPRVAGPAQPPEPAVTADALKGGNETVLVVEDEPPLRRLIARVLGDLGYRIVVAGSGPEALELLEDLDGSPDLLITDVILPGGMQGNELAGECAAAVPGLPVLYMSGHPRDAIVHAGRLDEGVHFLGKPFTPRGLAAKVREVLGSRPR